MKTPLEQLDCVHTNWLAFTNHKYVAFIDMASVSHSNVMLSLRDALTISGVVVTIPLGETN